MAITSVDTYLQKTLQTNLQELLSSDYIIKEQVLKDFDPQIRDSFVHTFGTGQGNEGVDIPILFTYPATKEPTRGFILIQFQSGAEKDEPGGGSSLGTLQGMDNDQDGQYYTESAELKESKQADGSPVMYVDLGFSVYKVLSLNNIPTDSVVGIRDNRVYIRWSPLLEKVVGKPLVVRYAAIAQSSTDNKPIASRSVNTYGYEIMEAYTVDSISNNMDTLRCLDALLKTCFAVMRLNPSEQLNAKLQGLEFKGTDLVQQVNNATNSLTGDQLFYRRAIVSYSVAYSVNIDQGILFNKINLDNSEGVHYEAKSSESVWKVLHRRRLSRIKQGEIPLIQPPKVRLYCICKRIGKLL